MASRHPNRIVAIDSMILVWGVRKVADDKGNLDKARILFEKLEEDEAVVIVPSVVVAEYAAQVSNPAERQKTVAEIANLFRVEPFDVKDAALAASLFNHGNSRRKKGANYARACLKADAMIVATARNRGAREFYSEDTNCLQLAKRAKMEARRLPTIENWLIRPR